MSLRIATFNCENLFSRSRILDFNDNPEETKRAQAALDAVAALKKILAKKTFTKADKEQILDLIEAGRGFFTVQEDRGTLLQRKRVVARGSQDFLAHIRFTTKPISEEAVRNTGKVIAGLVADVTCVVEVENRGLLGKFNSEVLGTKRFRHHMLIDGNDQRGIDVGLLTRFPLRSIRTHVDDVEGSSKIFSRDCAEYEVALPSGKSLWILCNHLKSKGFGKQAANDARRKKQAARVAQILRDNFDLTKDLVVVAGDLNDTPDSDPLAPLVAVPDVHNIVDTLPAAERFTHIFRKDQSQLDYLLVSTPLRDALATVTIERRGMFTFPDRFKSITTAGHEASDHAAIVAEFSV